MAKGEENKLGTLRGWVGRPSALPRQPGWGDSRGHARVRGAAAGTELKHPLGSQHDRLLRRNRPELLTSIPVIGS